MSDIANGGARKRNGSGSSVVRSVTTGQQEISMESRSLIGPSAMQMTSQTNYDIAPLSDEEVRRLPVAHQYSS